MTRYTAFLERFRWPLALFIPLLMLMIGVGIKDIGFEGGYRIWFAEESPQIREYDRFKQVFGSDDTITIAFRDEAGIFRPEAIQTVRRITQKLWQIPHAQRVISLTNFPYVQTDGEDGILVESFFPGDGDISQELCAAKGPLALADPQMAGALISPDGKTTLIAMKLAVGARDKNKIDFELRNRLEALLESERELTGYEFALAGALPMQTGFVRVMLTELLIFIPLIAGAVSALLWLIFRRVSAVIVPMSVVGLAIVVTVAIQVLLGYRINNFTADIPVVVLAIGIATTVHLYATWHARINRGEENRAAVAVALQKNLLPIFLSSLTTAIGFGSLATSAIVPVHTLGLATAGAVILVFLLCAVLMPAMLLLIPHPKPLRHSLQKARFLPSYGAFITRNRQRILWGYLLLAVIIGAGIERLQVDSNLIRFLDKTVDERQSAEFIMEQITGPMGYEIVIDSGQAGGIKDPAFMTSVERFNEAFSAAFPEVRHISALTDVIKDINRVMHQNDQSFYEIPKTQETVAQYLLLYSLSLPEGFELNDNMDVDERFLRVSAQTDIVYAKRDLEMIDWAKRWWRDSTPYAADIYGQTKMFAHMQTDVTDTLIRSIGASIVLVSLVMLAVFRRIRLLYVYLLPNLLPFLLVLGVMGWLGIAVDLGVAISGAVILGIAVDDTMHFLVKYFHARKEGLSAREAFDDVMSQAGRAIIITTLILSLSFLFLTASRFVPNAHFGLITATALMIALITDLLLLPALLSFAEKEKA